VKANPVVSKLCSKPRTASSTAFCHYVLWYHYLVRHYSEFCSHNPLCCFAGGVHCCACLVWSVVFWWLICRNSAFALKFCSSLRKSAFRVHEMLKMAFMTILLGEHSLLIGFLNMDLGKLKIMSFQVIPSQVAQMKMWKMLVNSSP